MTIDSTLLVEAARRGDREAFGQLVRRTRSVVRLVIYRQVRPNAVNDVVQDTYLAAWKGISRLREPRAFVAWIAKIAWGRAMRWKERNELEEATLPKFAIEEAYEPRYGSVWSEPVLRALDTLDPATRTIVIMKFCEGYTAVEIADALDLSADAVRQRLTRAKAKLKRLLGSLEAQQ